MEIFFRIIFFITLAGIVSCVQGPNLSEVPSLEYIKISKDTMLQGSGANDFLTLFLSIEDGDGDIGNDQEDGIFNLFVFDSRTDQLYDQANLIPEVPNGIAQKGVLIDMELTVLQTCCVFPENIPPCESPQAYPMDSLYLDIYIIDRAGNKSNTVRSDLIHLICD